MVRKWEMLGSRSTPAWRTTTCKLSGTAYSIYSHLPSVSGDRHLQPQPEDAPYLGDSDQLKVKHILRQDVYV